MMQLELRDYQVECVKRTMEAYEKNKAGRELLVLPTGAGKTVIFCEIIHRLAKQYGLNALIVAHRDELLDQAAEKYRLVRPEAVIGKVGSGVHQYGGEVTVASIATISRPEHVKRLQAIGYGLVIVDEAHHVAADGYQRVLNALPEAFVLLVTATPDRLDKKEILGEKKPLYSASIIDMIRDKYLCDVKAIAIRTHVSLDGLHTQMGDFNEKELETAVNTPDRNKRVVEAYREHCPERRAICFAVTVGHATALCRAFNERGVPAGVVSGETPLDERKRLYQALRTGDIRVLTNVQVLTEGYDEPLVDCVIMARPTQSRGLYVQSIGRGLRLAPAKQNCVILDLTDNCLRHRLEPQSLSKALGKVLKDDETVVEAEEREQREVAEKQARVRRLKDTRVQDIQVDLMEKLIWQVRTDGMYTLEVGKEKHKIAIVASGEYEGLYDVWARLAPFYDAQMWAGDVPLDMAQQIAEKKARLLLSNVDNIKLVDRNAPWRFAGASEKQLELLQRFGVAHDPMVITKGEASDLLDPIFEKMKSKRKVAV